VLPAADAKKLVPSKGLVPSAAQAVAAPAVVRAPRANAFAPLPFFFQAAAPALQTFAADCTTPKSDWNLGEVVCVKVDGTANASRVQLVNPSGYAVFRADVGFGPQEVTFTIPSDATLTSDDSTFDNRGTWRVTLVDAPSAGALLSVPITVHDPQQTVANLQIVKALNGGLAVAGADVSSVIRVYNAGPDAASNVTFTDVPPANTTFLSLVQTGGPTFTCTTPAANAAGTSQCNRASLGRDEAADFVLTYRLNTSVADATDLTSSATVSSDTVETSNADNGSADSTTTDNPTPPACTISYTNVTAAAAAGQNGANVTFPAPTISGTCGAITTSPASGSFFHIGTSSVTATTSNGYTSSFVVTVTDEEAPAISCPQDIVVNESPAGSGSANVSFSTSASDNSGQVRVDCNPDSGSSFPVGITSVTCTASDPSGNTAACTFNVEVKEAACAFAQPLDIVEDADVAGTANSSCGANVTFDTPVATCPPDAPPSTVTCDRPSGSFFPVGDTLVTCKSSPDGAMTSFTVTVKDVTAPVPDLAALPTITQECSATAGIPTVVQTPAGPKAVIELPTATDNCGLKIAASTDDPRTYDSPGTYTVHWTYSDAAGNTATQNQTVVVTADIAGPIPDLAALPAVTGECSATVTEVPTATDNCSGGEVFGTTTDPLTYTTVGTHTVKWTYTDAAGNKSFQNQSVVVTDTHPPVASLVGPASVTVECHTSYADAGATATDNCSAAPALTSTSNVDVNTPGTYQVVWTAKDAGNNTHSVTRTVVVVDTIKPVITLNGADPVTILLHSAFVDPGAAASDSCAGSFPATASGTVNNHAVGTYVITYNATDPAGNAADPVTRTVKVIYDFGGFFSPVSNPPTINQVNAGRSVPVKFSLAGNQGLGIFAAGSPYSQQVTCGSNNVTDIQETGTAGSSSLSYDASSDRYNYVWKTESSWAGTCRVLTVGLIDGTTHTAYFKFK
jgi:uncharacterized repeat protein (TIGR01451 family)